MTHLSNGCQQLSNFYYHVVNWEIEIALACDNYLIQKSHSEGLILLLDGYDVFPQVT